MLDTWDSIFLNGVWRRRRDKRGKWKGWVELGRADGIWAIGIGDWGNEGTQSVSQSISQGDRLTERRGDGLTYPIITTFCSEQDSFQATRKKKKGSGYDTLHNLHGCAKQGIAFYRRMA